MIIQAQEKKAEVNAMILRSLSECSDRDHFGSVMNRRKKLMGHMVVGLVVVIDWVDMTQ